MGFWKDLTTGMKVAGGAIRDLFNGNAFKSSSTGTQTSVGNGNISTPVGNTWRGVGSGLFNGTAIASEDWQRQEQQAMNAFERQSAFNREEAQKERDFQERMASTQYTRAVDDMKKSGINPILAYSNGGADMTASSQANVSSGGSSSYEGYQNNTISSLVNLFAGLYTAGARNALLLNMAGSRNATLLEISKNNKKKR